MSYTLKDGAQFYHEAENGFDKLRLEEIILFTFSRGKVLLPFLLSSLYVSGFFFLIVLFVLRNLHETVFFFLSSSSSFLPSLRYHASGGGVFFMFNIVR